MPTLIVTPPWQLAACIAAALLLTLVLASFLTPRSWWRRANARALAVLVVGTALFCTLFMLVLPRPMVPRITALVAPTPAPVQTYRVHDDLNLRAASGTGAARIAVVPGGSLVTTTGRRDGDWWEVSATVGQRPVTGWASSLWLRRDDESRRQLIHKEKF